LRLSADAEPAVPSAAHKINAAHKRVPDDAFRRSEAQTAQQGRSMTRNPAAIHTHAHGKAVCGTFQIRDEDFGGRSSRIGSALAIVRDGGATNSTAIRVNTAIGIVTGMTPAR